MAVNVIIVTIIVALVILAIRGAIKNPNPCDTCGGNSSSCHKAHCSHTGEIREGYYRDQKLNQLWEETRGSNSKAGTHS
ncbi:hypothetical protein [Bilifractor porci]|uniref:FeoB-associated Cys-rich membrane protein n=1 Tax=Bilifractor porci TaxID=2606636 RepID=A0A7X2PAR1_9FIRM|nr:hypothetical protein [Bilifractor porci]MST82926.1 hypothetical protein [Bilifractor porci]